MKRFAMMAGMVLVAAACGTGKNDERKSSQRPAEADTRGSAARPTLEIREGDCSRRIYDSYRDVVVGLRSADIVRSKEDRIQNLKDASVACSRFEGLMYSARSCRLREMPEVAEGQIDASALERPCREARTRLQALTAQNQAFLNEAVRHLPRETVARSAAEERIEMKSFNGKLKLTVGNAEATRRIVNPTNDMGKSTMVVYGHVVPFHIGKIAAEGGSTVCFIYSEQYIARTYDTTESLSLRVREQSTLQIFSMGFQMASAPVMATLFCVKSAAASPISLADLNESFSGIIRVEVAPATVGDQRQ